MARTIEIADARERREFSIDVEVVDDVLHGSGPSAIALYCTLCRYSLRAGEVSVAKLCEIIGISARQLRRARDILVDRGLVRVETRCADNGARSSNRYVLLPVGANRAADSPAPDDLAEGSSATARESAQPSLFGDVSDDASLEATRVDEVGEVVAAWNDLAAELRLPRCRVVNGQLRSSIAARLADRQWRADWRRALEKIRGCDFLLGKNDRGWRANLIWFARPSTVAKLIDGAYTENHWTANEDPLLLVRNGEITSSSPPRSLDVREFLRRLARAEMLFSQKSTGLIVAPVWWDGGARARSVELEVESASRAVGWRVLYGLLVAFLRDPECPGHPLPRTAPAFLKNLEKIQAWCESAGRDEFSEICARLAHLDGAAEDENAS